jgi:hypothetical protein
VTQSPDEVLASMNASRILVSILETLGSVSVTTDTFINSNQNDRNLKVEYNEETLSFIFRLDKNAE